MFWNLITQDLLGFYNRKIEEHPSINRPNSVIYLEKRRKKKEKKWTKYLRNLNKQLARENPLENIEIKDNFIPQDPCNILNYLYEEENNLNEKS